MQWQPQIIKAGAFCWVKTAEGVEKRSLQLGDSNERFTVVEAGLQEGDEVVLNPIAFEEAKALIQPADDETQVQDPNARKDRKTSETGEKPESRFDAMSKPSGPKSTKRPKPKDQKQSLSKQVPVTK